MTGSKRNLSLGDAATHFLSRLSSEERGPNQQEVYRFARWYGWDRPFTALKAPEIANYAKQLSSSDKDYMRNLELIKAFLNYAKKENWTSINLAVHLKVSKGKSQTKKTSDYGRVETISLTQEGHAELEAELAALKGRRPRIIDEIRRAAADKDFRENAPLEAARQEHGQLEGRIKKLERIVQSSVIIGEKEKIAPRASIGDTVVLRDVASGKELRYMLVNPREVNPSKGKISNLSPIGKAITGQEQGQIVEVTVPAGKLRYEIKRIER